MRELLQPYAPIPADARLTYGHTGTRLQSGVRRWCRPVAVRFLRRCLDAYTDGFGPIRAVAEPLDEPPKERAAYGIRDWGLISFEWAQLAAVYEHGLAYARSMTFYDTTLLWQWMRLPGDLVLALGALLMAWDLTVKSLPLLVQSVGRWIAGSQTAGVLAGE